jgi:hypothetical protein
LTEGTKGDTITYTGGIKRMAASLVNTKWGTVVVQVKQPATENPGCKLSEHPCSMLAYLAMTGKNKTFAAIHNHGADRLWVVNLTVKNEDETEFLVTGPYNSIADAVYDAAGIYGRELERQQTAGKEKKQGGVAVGASTMQTGARMPQPAANLDRQRSADKLDWEAANSSEVSWEQQLRDLMHWRV